MGDELRGENLVHLNVRFSTETELKKIQDFLYEKSGQGVSFTGLVEAMANEVTIVTAVHNIKANKGSRTAGVDKMKMDKYLQMPKDELILLIQSSFRNYRPKPARREYIEKSNGKKRPLGIPTVLDRIIQECVRIIIEPICEARFYPQSYGFRPYRAQKHAIRGIINVINAGCKSPDQPVWAIEGDIKGCFDNINHRLLLQKLWRIGIHDKRVLKIISQMLKAGYMENDLFHATELGTPQGGILSPLLSNVYLPELMSMFKEVADIKTSDQLHLPVPEAKFETVVAKPSEIQKEMVQELSKRAAEIHSGTVDASVDNMLCVTNDGRKIGLDVRLMNPMLPDDPNSKLNVCVRNVLKIWDEGKDQKLTQLLFCDLSTPKNDGNFNVYDDIRKKLVAAGVPENEIEFIHNADTEAKKAALFSKVRSGDVRVLLGSTAKMGAGTNVQSRLVAVHHLDVGWKPSDMTQRNGRIIRQGNMNKEVKVFNYVTEGTFDSYLFQTLENKQRFISQIMTSKSPVRSCEDVDEQALSYAEIKALCAGNPLIKEKMDLDVQVAKLKVLKADHQSQKFRLQDKLLTKFPADIRETNAYIAGVKADAQLAAAHPQVQEGFCGMTIKGVTYDEKKTAGERLVLACSELPNAEEKVIGSYRGFELSLRFDTFRSEYQAILKGERRYPVALGTDPLGNIIRLDNSLNNFPERINSAENELATLHQQQAAAQIEVEKPFPQEEELAEKSARLAELNAQLDVDEKNHEPEQDEEEQEDAPRRPSVLAALEEKSDKPEPVKPFRSYYDKDGDAR